jgi:hypothetical protein
VDECIGDDCGEGKDVLEHVEVGLASLVLGRTMAGEPGGVGDMGDVGEEQEASATSTGSARLS